MISQIPVMPYTNQRRLPQHNPLSKNNLNTFNTSGSSSTIIIVRLAFEVRGVSKERISGNPLCIVVDFAIIEETKFPRSVLALSLPLRKYKG
jgi:hypothetical protein